MIWKSHVSFQRFVFCHHCTKSNNTSLVMFTPFNYVVYPWYACFVCLPVPVLVLTCKGNYTFQWEERLERDRKMRDALNQYWTLIIHIFNINHCCCCCCCLQNGWHSGVTYTHTLNTKHRIVDIRIVLTSSRTRALSRRLLFGVTLTRSRTIGGKISTWTRGACVRSTT